MNRTDAQVKADEALTAAIQNALEAYGVVDPGEMLQEYVILSVSQRITDDGVVLTNHPVLFTDGDLPWYKIIGIIEIHRKLADRLMLDGNDNG